MPRVTETIHSKNQRIEVSCSYDTSSRTISDVEVTLFNHGIKVDMTEMSEKSPIKEWIDNIDWDMIASEFMNEKICQE